MTGNNQAFYKDLTTKAVKVLMVVAPLVVLGACSSKQVDKTPFTKIYHAPAQSYNLALNNPAIMGKPALKSSCSIKGNTLEIRDQVGSYYKIDVINLLADSAWASGSDIRQISPQVIDYYKKLYSANVAGSAKAKMLNESHTFVPLEYAQDGKNQTVGLLISKQDDFVFVVQHVQNQYNEKQMLQALSTLANHMNIPGRFFVPLSQKAPKNASAKLDKDKKPSGYLEQKENIGFIKIDPATASSSDIATWKQKARC